MNQVDLKPASHGSLSTDVGMRCRGLCSNTCAKIAQTFITAILFVFSLPNIEKPPPLLSRKISLNKKKLRKKPVPLATIIRRKVGQDRERLDRSPRCPQEASPAEPKPILRPDRRSDRSGSCYHALLSPGRGCIGDVSARDGQHRRILFGRKTRGSRPLL